MPIRSRTRAAIRSLAEQFEALDVAAAAAKLLAAATQVDGSTEAAAGIDNVAAAFDEDRPRRDRGDVSRGAQDARSKRTQRVRADRRSGGMTWLVIELGEKRGVRAKDLVGAITNEANISGDAIGAIEIRERQSLVEVLDAEADNVIRALSRATIRGQRVTARRERGG